MNEIPYYFRYWGKADLDGNYHLLPYHCLDVAAVGYSLLDITKLLCRRLAGELEVKPLWLQKWFAFCLSLHDIGKFATAFQGQIANLSENLVPSNSMMPYTKRHDTLGFILWQKVLEDYWLDEGGLGCKSKDSDLRKILKAVTPWMEIVSGHHGIPPKKEVATTLIANFFTEHDEQAAWLFFKEMAKLFLSDINLELICDKHLKKRLKLISWQLAGLVVFSDWLGSGLDNSEYQTDEVALETYWSKYALSLSNKTLKKVNLTPSRVSNFTNIRNLFPFIEETTPLQQWAENVVIDDSAQLFILEDVTGSGKTEAALGLAHRLMSKGIADGIYVALPTMATSNAMYERLGKAYRKLYADDANPSIVLAHSATKLSKDFRESVGLLENTRAESDYDKDEPSAGAYCNAWLADSRKKALLAEVGVGTLDQALLGVLPARHQSLRLLGMARKILIVDEVHSYDPYMNQLLQTLLEAHAHQGGSVILLSATLPQKMRENYVNAFCAGAGLEPSALSAEPSYPLATHVPSQDKCEISLQTRREVARDVDISLLTEEEQVLEIIQAASEKGQCICWVRNTVGDACKTYDQLCTQSWIDKDRLGLFHSRFAMVDRQRIENETLDFFGITDSSSEKRRGRVLIATQVVEQSLDLDFDVMISDLAPMDLIIQRAGRLHRHIRDTDGSLLSMHGKTDKRGKPIMYIFGPEWTESPKADWLKAKLPGTQAVYRHLGQMWLTQKCLVNSGTIRMPSGARQLINDVYGDRAQSEIPEELLSKSFDAEGDAFGKIGLARLNALDLAKGYTWASAESSGGWADETRIPTRLSNKTITVALVRIKSGELTPYADVPDFAWEQSMIQLPEREWKNVQEKISSEYHMKIEELKKNIRVLKWVEVLPLTAEIQPYYDPYMGWGLNKEEANESD